MRFFLRWHALCLHSIYRAKQCSTWNILLNILVALFPCLCYCRGMLKSSYLVAVGALRGRYPVLCRFALVHASLVVGSQSSYCESVLLWLQWRAVAAFCAAALSQGVPRA